ncbi:MAG: alpha/beta fold hydrolase [Arenimonas sp.]
MNFVPPLQPITPDAWARAGREWQWRDHSLFVRVGGHGPALLLLHGFPTSSWDWARVWPRLLPRHKLFALDMLGFGRSDKPRDFAYSVLAAADQWQDFAHEHGVTEAHVLAHDYGDSVAQELLARQVAGVLPFRIASVVFLNGGLFPEAHKPLRLQRWLAGPLGPLVARLAGYDRFAANLRRICTAPLADEELREHWRLLRLADGHLVLPAVLGYLRERRTHRDRWLDAMQRADIPMRLVVGLDDPVSGAAIARRYRAVMPVADVVELAGIGHYPQIEDPEAVVLAVVDFHDAGGSPEGRRDPDALSFFGGVDRRTIP